MKQIPTMLFNHFQSGSMCSILSIIPVVYTRFSSLYMWSLPLQGVCVFYICVCESISPGYDLISGVWLCSRNPAPHLPICPSLSAHVTTDESSTRLPQVITGLFNCFMESSLSHWYVACLSTFSITARPQVPAFNVTSRICFYLTTLQIRKFFCELKYNLTCKENRSCLY